MGRKSLQQIEDFYVDLGFTGARLRKVLGKDVEYQQFIEEKKQKPSKQLKAAQSKRKKYVLSTNADLKFLQNARNLKG